MIFGFGKKRQQDDEDEENEEVEYVLFQGALNGKEANLGANAKLAQAGLIPTKEIVTDALLRRADQLRLEPKGDRAVVQLLIDGIPAAGSRLSKQQALAVTQMMKLLSGLNTQQRQKPQSGGVRAEYQGTKYELRVVSAPVAEGTERLVVKIRNLSRAPKSTEEVGFSAEMKAKIRELTGQKKGILLVCGSSSSGVSTTTFGVLRCVDAYQYTVYTIGDRQGWDLPNVTPFDTEEGEELESVLHRAMRAEADVIYLDPLRKAETAKVIAKMQDLACFIAEFPTPDAAVGIVQFVKLVGNNETGAESLVGTLSQTLIRTLCKDCRLTYRPNPKVLAKIGLPPETKSLYRAGVTSTEEPERGEELAGPCETCGGTGYIGRTAIFELVEMTPAMRKLAASGANSKQIKALARDEKMFTAYNEGLRLVVEGKTSLEELQRVFRPKK